MSDSAAPIATPPKDPNAVLDYTINWTRWLQPGEYITSSSWVVPAGLGNAGTFASGGAVTIFLTGGASGTSYSVVNQIQTSGNRTDKRTLQINVVDR